MVTVLRPLSTSELLDRTFHLYRNNFLVFVGIAALPQLAVLALQFASSAMLLGGSFAGFGATAVVAGLGGLGHGRGLLPPCYRRGGQKRERPSSTGRMRLRRVARR